MSDVRCPRCDGTRIYFNHYFMSWRCASCESSFRTPKYLSDLTNLRLLEVKWFLAEDRPWKEKYKKGKYVCADFAKEVYQEATKELIRCGFVTIYFDSTNIAHAIVCFQTDYGLIYFEPQSGNEIDVKVGQRYPDIMDGVPNDCAVRYIEIRWNDG